MLFWEIITIHSENRMISVVNFIRFYKKTTFVSVLCIYFFIPYCVKKIKQTKVYKNYKITIQQIIVCFLFFFPFFADFSNRVSFFTFSVKSKQLTFKPQ